ncbi:MAG: hypothetical protein WC360_03390 [Opitutales bacterium]|jgi:hypothetical protein
MIKKRALLPCLLVLASAYSYGVGPVTSTGATVTFSAFDTVSGGVFDSLPTAHFCAYAAENTNVTHLVIKSLGRVSSNASLIGGDYVLVNSDTGDELGGGAIAFEVAPDPDSSPIVGVIPLTGGWDSASLTISTPDSILGGKTATLTYNPTAGAMTMDIGGTISTLNYVANNEGSVHIEAPFWISDGTDTTKFVNGFMDNMGDGTIKGLVMTDFSGNLDDAIYMVAMIDTPDLDGDGVPEFMDANNYWYSGCNYDNQTGKIYSQWFGEFWFCYTPRHDDAWNGFLPENHSFYWHNQHGYQYGEAYTDADGTRWAFLYDYKMGWLATNENVYPYMYAYDARVGDETGHGPTWMYFVLESGHNNDRIFYAYSGDLNLSSSFGTGEGLQGWWGIPGAYTIN